MSQRKLVASLKFTSILIWAFTVMFFSVGLHTYSWDVVPGRIVEARLNSQFVGGYNTPWATEGIVAYNNVRYEYRVGSSLYVADQICFCLPIGVLHKLPSESETLIYVYPGNASASVLEPGPDYFLALMLLFAGWIPRYLVSLLLR